MASIFPLATFVRLRNVYDSIAQRDSNFSMIFKVVFDDFTEAKFWVGCHENVSIRLHLSSST